MEDRVVVVVHVFYAGGDFHVENGVACPEKSFRPREACYAREPKESSMHGCMEDLLGLKESYILKKMNKKNNKK